MPAMTTMNRMIQGFLLCAFSAAMFGCGGGGSSSPGTVLTYSTDWGNGTTVRSQVVSVTDSSGHQLASSQTLGDTTQNSVTFKGLPTGSVHVVATAYSDVQAAGSVVGTVDTYLTVAAQTAVSSAVSGSVASVGVSPVTATINTGQTQTLAASAKTATGVYVFTAPTDWTWSATGAATVDQSGIATGNSAGISTVTATHKATGKSSTASLTVGQNVITHGKWTVMVYMNASNSLWPYAPLNMNQMERVANNSDVRFVVQWKQVVGLEGLTQDSKPLFDGTMRYLVGYDASSGTSNTSIKSTPVQYMGTDVDMGDWHTLRNFVQWATTNYPADHYVLDLWSHGDGWRVIPFNTLGKTRSISWDEKTGSQIDVWQLASALQGYHLDILSFDACLMQMAEVADEVKANVDYMAGSEDLTPAAGYPYDLVFRNFASNPTDTPANLSKGFVTGMTTYSPYQSTTITQSVVEISKLPAVLTAINGLSDALMTKETSLSTLVPAVRNAATKFDVTTLSSDYYYDLDQLAGLIASRTTVPEVKTAAQAVQTAVANAVIWNGQIGEPYAKGLAIDFESKLPDIGGSSYWNLQLSKDTSWANFLRIAP